MSDQTGRRRLLIGARVVVGAAGLFCAAAVAFLVWGLYFNAIQLSASAFACLVAAVSTWRIGTTDLSPLAETDGAGTAFRPGRGLDASRQLASFAMVVSIVPVMCLPLLVTPSLIAAIPGLVVLALSALLVWRTARRGATSFLRLSPGGIELGRHARTRACNWTEIRDVTGEAPKKWGLKPSDLVIIVSDTESLRLPAGAFGPNAAALRALVEFYWRHPEFRGELTDGSAPRRLAATLGVFR